GSDSAMDRSARRLILRLINARRTFGSKRAAEFLTVIAEPGRHQIEGMAVASVPAVKGIACFQIPLFELSSSRGIAPLTPRRNHRVGDFTGADQIPGVAVVVALDRI